MASLTKSKCSTPREVREEGAAQVRASCISEAVEFLVSSVESLANVEGKNLCVECGEDMGPQNPRQLCGKWRCTNAAW